MRAFLFSVIGGVLGGIAGLNFIGAGLYLLSFRPAGAIEAGLYNASGLDVLAHGIGMLAIASGTACWAATCIALRQVL